MYSVYIPTIHINNTEDVIRQQFSLNNVGNVVRVDFAPFPNEDKKDFRQAFVHFIPLAKSDIIIAEIETEGSYRFYPDINKNYYWILCKNKAPVPDTQQNIHQLSHNAKLMEEREAQMAQKIAQMEEHTKQMEERMAKMEGKMSLVIQLNEKMASVIEVQALNIQTLSRLSIKEEPVKEEPVKEEVKVKLEEGVCRICSKVEVPHNEVICAVCLSHCEPATTLTMESIETEFCNIKTEGEERYWRFHDKFVQELGQYSADTLHLFDSNKKDIEKLADKNGKNVEDIEYCIDRINYIMSSSRHSEERINRIMEVVHYLVEQVAGKQVAGDKYSYMKFNAIEKCRLALTVEELL
jgi:hypothetical protein